MKRLLVIHLIVLSISGFISAQNINQFDANGKHHGIWKKNFDDTDVLRYEGAFQHGKEVGVFKFYKNIKGRAVLTATKQFNADNDIAEVQFLASNGKVISEGQMKGRLRVGIWKYYQKNNNNLLTTENYNAHGVLDGERLVYYSSGQVSEKELYEEGKLEGITTVYSEANVIIKEITYSNDMLHGSFKVYSADGKLEIDGQFQNDKKVGLWRYYEKGELIEQKKF
ncbi:toxin-antitoxin system YwqK family antitoxin [Gaetbulibacter saemankumensis]|uniref:toxin-antitoxin system YwqK family antitoxin n=1 Tax=Gaetbulibacter saemankumensis TaxID=311208 RepID=UPI0003FF3CB4|nr:hypothetical protein [Gaetbulibacter saemankumensis]